MVSYLKCIGPWAALVVDAMRQEAKRTGRGGLAIQIGKGIMTKEHDDPSKHKRQSMRLPAYDYSSDGAYFVTISLQERKPLLEEAELHTILVENWNALPLRFPGVKLDDFVIMPDHIHFILWLTSHEGNVPTLGQVVGAYKSLTGRAALNYLRRQRHILANQFWQRGYYEHVIRSEFELQQKRAYIRNNPLKEELKAENQF